MTGFCHRTVRVYGRNWIHQMYVWRQYAKDKVNIDVCKANAFFHITQSRTNMGVHRV